jgi:hypothetical protein
MLLSAHIEDRFEVRMAAIRASAAVQAAEALIKRRSCRAIP